VNQFREEIIGGQRLVLADCLDFLPTLPAASFDTVLTDPPYPCIKRSYGTWTEAEWHAMMDVVVPQSRRVLKPTGSAVYILQPNSEKVGRMRPWLWEFMAKWGREWGMVQDAWWWNTCSLPGAAASIFGLMRSSLKVCAWFGDATCYRAQGEVLWDESDYNRMAALEAKAGRVKSRSDAQSGHSVDNARCRSAASRRGGVTPFNILPIGNGAAKDATLGSHGASTPFALCDWWLRYICPPGGSVLEPFMGSGTVLVAAELQGKTGVGCETVPEYFDIACRRVEEAVKKAEQERAQLTLEDA